MKDVDVKDVCKMTSQYKNFRFDYLLTYICERCTKMTSQYKIFRFDYLLTSICERCSKMTS